MAHQKPPNISVNLSHRDAENTEDAEVIFYNLSVSPFSQCLSVMLLYLKKSGPLKSRMARKINREMANLLILDGDALDIRKA